jgi:viologen exporter family transport system permease protein
VAELVQGVRTYLLLAGIAVRAAMAYRASFAMLTLSQFLATFIDFAAIVVMFSNVRSLGGFGLGEIALLYGVSSLGIGVADLLVGNCERLGRKVRDGSFDVMMIRPAPPLVQVATDAFSLRRLGRIGQALVVLVWSLISLHIEWTVAKAAMLVGSVVCGVLIFSAVFVLGGAFQFWALDSAEVSNAFTYGGNYLTQYPLTIYPGEVVKAITFIVPLAFVNWYPVLYVLGRDVPGGLPDGLRFAAPVVALAMWTLAVAVWSTGMRRYQSTGS